VTVTAIARYLASRPVEDFFGRPAGAVVVASDWLLRADWLGAVLVLGAEGDVPADVRSVLRGADKKPAGQRHWLAWARTVEGAVLTEVPVRPGGCADVQREFIAGCLASTTLSVASFAMLVGEANGAVRLGDRGSTVVELDLADPWLDRERRARLVIDGARPGTVRSVSNAPDLKLAAAYGPEDQAWFVSAGGFAIEWIRDTSTLALELGEHTWRVEDPVAARAARAVCESEGAQ